jgi:hypothetical protein
MVELVAQEPMCFSVTTLSTGAVNTYSGIIYNNPVCVTSTSLKKQQIVAVTDSPSVIASGNHTKCNRNDTLNGQPAVIGISQTSNFDFYTKRTINNEC